MKSIPQVAIALVSLASCAAAPSAGNPRQGRLLADWNQRLLAVAEAEDHFLTLKGVRAAALMHLAIHDALNAIEPRFATYLPVRDEPGADPLAAAVQAAFVVASDQYPDQRAQFERARALDLAAVSEGSAKQGGLALGERCAKALLAARAGDGWDSESEYQWHPMAPGVYAELGEHSGTPEGFVFGAGWAVAWPFALDDPAQFRSPPPPAIDSEEYTRAFDEVKAVGAFVSSVRTADQSHLAMWWKDFVESSHNRLARDLITEETLDLWAAARLFALLEMSIYDAYISVFDNKFHYNHWRPYTAIRWAAEDGNPRTEPDPEWNNLHRHTYPFPSYPSAHGTACAAAMTVFEEVLGADRPLTMTTERVDRAGPLSGKVAMEPATRSFPSFAAAAEECSLSRVFLGIHFRYDSVAGTALGRRLGSWVVEHSLAPRGAGPR